MITLAKASRWVNHKLLGGRNGHMFCSRMYLAHNKPMIALLDKLLGKDHCKECFYEDVKEIRLEDEGQDAG